MDMLKWFGHRKRTNNHLISRQMWEKSEGVQSMEKTEKKLITSSKGQNEMFKNYCNTKPCMKHYIQTEVRMVCKDRKAWRNTASGDLN